MYSFIIIIIIYIHKYDFVQSCSTIYHGIIYIHVYKRVGKLYTLSIEQCSAIQKKKVDFVECIIILLYIYAGVEHVSAFFLA